MEEKRYGVCCFTGHRELPRESLPELRDLLRRAVRYAYAHGVREFRAGGALGFDTLAALTVLELREEHPELSLCLYLPCRDQDRGWSERNRAIFREILGRADRVRYISEEYYHGCMQRRNRALVDGSDVCVAFCRHLGGGSAYTVKYAKEEGLTVWNLGLSLHHED